MAAARKLKPFEENSLGLLLPVEMECKCSPTKRLPIKWVASGVEAVKRQLNGYLKEDIPILTTRCPVCGGKAVHTLSDLLGER